MQKQESCLLDRLWPEHITSRSKSKAKALAWGLIVSRQREWNVNETTPAAEVTTWWPERITAAEDARWRPDPIGAARTKP